MEPPIKSRAWSKAINWVVLLAVGFILFGWLLNTPPGILGKADAVGYAVCHRIDLRSFHLGDRPLPLCARCSGMYLGAVLALLFQAWRAPRSSGLPPRPILFLAGFMALAFAIDGVNSLISILPGSPEIYAPQNWLRLLTGTGMGLAIALVLYPAFNQTVWQKQDYRPAVDSWKTMVSLLALAALVDVAILSEISVVLYPLALISAVGVLTLLTLSYTMIWLLVFKRANRIQHWKELILPVAAGFGVALLQIAVLDAVRFLLTGSWEGFHFG